MAKRIAITATGTALLALIAAEGFLFVTQAEGSQAVIDGNATISAEPVAPDGLTTIVLTDAGKAIVASLPPAVEAAAPVAKPVFVLRDDIPIPLDAARNARASKYPTESMVAGQSFHIPTTAEMPKPVAAIASTLTALRAKFAVQEVIDGAPQFHKVKKHTYQMEADGKTFSKDADGKRIVLSTGEVEEPKMVNVRDWTVKPVGATDPDGVGARVFCTK